MSYKIKRQDLSIESIDFSQQSFKGITKLLIFPLECDLKTILLNCNGPVIKKIVFNLINSPTDAFNAIYEIHNDDMISLHIPRELVSSVNKLEPFFLLIYFTSQGNQCGLQFVISSTGSKADYMYMASYNNCSGCCFPCIELDQACEWFIEIISPRDDMIAICSGCLESKMDDIYLFHIERPTTASKISFAVGQFEYFSDPDNPKFEYYFISSVSSYVKFHIDIFIKALKFLRSNIKFDYPFDIYKSIFVDYLLDEFYTASSLTLFNINLLLQYRESYKLFHSNHVLIAGLCEQYIGAFVEAAQWKDSWICWGFAEYMAWEMLNEFYPIERSDESIYEIMEKMNHLVEYENRNGGIVLDASFLTSETFDFDLFNPRKMPIRYKRFYRIKSGLVFRSWAMCMSFGGLCDTVRYYLLYQHSVDDKILDSYYLGNWRNLIEGAVKNRGHINIIAKAHYLKERKTVVLVIKQSSDVLSSIYSGDIECDIQESEGMVRRIVEINPTTINHIEIVLSSKLSLLKTDQKLITSRFEEIKGPSVGWIKLDPNLIMIGQVEIILDESQAELMFHNDDTFMGKLNGLMGLRNKRSVDHLGLLIQLIADRKLIPRIRIEAIQQLRNALCDPKVIFPKDSLQNLLINIYCEKDGANPVLKKNFWKTFGDYIIHLELIQAVSVTYVPESAEKLAELLLLFIEMLEYCGCATEKSVSYFRASLILAISVSFSQVSRSLIGEENLELYIDILNRQLIEELSFASHNFCVTSAVFHSWAKLHEFQLIKDLPISVYFSNFHDDNEQVRLAGISALLSLVNRVDVADEAIGEILNYLSKTEVPVTIRCKGVSLISDSLVSWKHSQNADVLENLISIFQKKIPVIMSLITLTTPDCLTASVLELVRIFQNLKSPITYLNTQSFEEILNFPISITETPEMNNVQLPLGSGDMNLSDDSD